jgi:diguanylate cyclase (GGDEF)-like protein
VEDGAPPRDEVLDGLSHQVGIVLDDAGRVVALTPAAHAALGGKLAVGMDFVDLVTPDDRPAALSLLMDSALANQGDDEVVTLRCAHLDGSYRTFACRSRSAAEGELVICADNVTSRDRGRAEVAVHDALVAVLQHRDDLTAVFDASVRLAEAGAPGTRAALYRVADDQMELVAASTFSTAWTRVAARVPLPDSASDAVDVEPATGRIAELAVEHGLGFGWTVLGADRANGAPTAVPGPTVVLCLFVGSKRFLTASERASAIRAADLAATAVVLHDRAVAANDLLARDALTGVLGRHALLAALDAVPRPLTLMLVHVGGIDAVNRAHGYEAGDATLRAVALALQGMVRRRDIVGRLSGATFAIAGPARRADHDADRWADRVREAVRTRLVASGRVLETACRVTYVMAPADSTAADTVLQAEAQLAGSVTGITDRADAGSGRRLQDR